MKKPWYPWYARDMFADGPVMLMSMEEEGCYRRLLDYQWLNGSVPSDLGKLGMICKGMSARRMATIWRVIGPLFPDGPDGRRRNNRLEEVRQEQDEVSTRQRENGRKGGRPGKPDESHSESQTEATAKPTKAKAKAESVSSETLLVWEADFEVAWRAYPRRPANPRTKAWRAYLARRREGVAAEALLAGVHAYAGYVARHGTEPKFVKMAATFFGPDRHWETEYDEPARESPGERALRLMGEEAA